MGDSNGLKFDGSQHNWVPQPNQLGVDQVPVPT